MATAIAAKTESSDLYVFCYDENLTTEEVHEKLKDELCEEYDYLIEYKVSYSK